MRFLADGGISPRTIEFLRHLGHEAEHIRMLGMQRASDLELVERARADRSVVVTFDLDFGDILALGVFDRPSVIIADTVKGGGPDEVIHIPAPSSALPDPGAELVAEIDWERRYRLMRMHTCLHLLCSIVPGAVTGGQVSDGRGRLDFDVPGSSLDKETLAGRLNALIAEAHPVGPRWITDAELAAQPELVRTMSVKPPSGMGQVRLMEIAGVDLQPCGGTHIRNTAEIGAMAVTKIENKGKQNRRVILAFAE